MTRIRLRPGVHYAPVDKGVFIGAASAKFVLTGPPALIRLLDACVPRLEDGCTEDDLLALVGGSEPGRAAVRHVLTAFRSHGLLLTPAQSGGPEPGADERARFADALCQLEAESVDPYGAFARLRAARVALRGPVRPLLPAARTLARCGFAEVVLLLSAEDLAAARAMAELHPAVTVLDSDSAEASALHVDAAVVLVALDADGTATTSTVRADTVVPVLVDDRAAVVGPVGGRAQEWARAAELHARAEFWAQDRGPLSRATGEALAVALAGQLLFRRIGGIERPENAYAVYGPTIEAEPLTVDLSSDDATEEPVLGPVGEHSAPSVDESLSAVQAVAVAWQGLVRLSTPDDLPQLPLALAAAESTVPGSPMVVRWAGDQAAAAVEAGLAGLRSAAAPGPDGAVGAAGLTRDRWLLDGALRVLARCAGEEAELPYGSVSSAEARRLWRALEDFEGVPARVVVRRVEGVDWRLAEVIDRSTGQVLSEGWGRDGGHATLAALGTALARVQVRRATAADLVGPQVETSAINDVEAAELALLQQQVHDHAAKQGGRFLGRARTADLLLGRLGPWSGPVRLEGDHGC
ncbi:hypothetical protein [Kitasatospora sp. SUK 42]|uniref:hypothetical protein n=1 Tax=Kitasatospora sp. SUK 42 TaxID=1588882 RepID=UPI0018CB79F4|nr:hypothetical protein [Kitasatospora sp. SUK 42]MBV2153689.1 hypothetical protein [Kitasatospora sp. SUK 42]